MNPGDPSFETAIAPYDASAVGKAATLILSGFPVAVPTETVYGLAADATSGEAVARIYAAKGRPAFNPLIVHVLGMEQAQALALFDPVSQLLVGRFWPGPLTLVLPLRPDSPLASLATAGLGTVALRAPVHPAMRDLIAASGRPLAAPSANRSGGISPTRAEHVLRSLRGRIPLVIDAGATRIGLESTIVAAAPDWIRLLREGPIDASALEEASGLPVVAHDGGTIEAPGQLASHYAPGKPLRLNATQAREGEWLIGFGRVRGNASLSPSGDLVEAAANLFDALHHADEARCAGIAVAPIPAEGIGAAINDRLARAAVPSVP